jgi:hypothetical protein
MLLLFLSLLACGDSAAVDAARSDAGRADAGPRRDAGPRTDGGPRRDAGTFRIDSGFDAGFDAAVLDAACAPFECPRPPDGCRYVPTEPCSCGDVVCSMECGAATCGPTQYCLHLEAASCRGAGVCLDRPLVCADEPPQVCGCDGRTYDNPCYAHAAGTDVAGTGPCTM